MKFAGGDSLKDKQRKSVPHFAPRAFNPWGQNILAINTLMTDKPAPGEGEQ